jgi:hypothetical protein
MLGRASPPRQVVSLRVLRKFARGGPGSASAGQLTTRERD